MPTPEKFSRDSILAAARDVAVDAGLDGVTVTAIAKQLGAPSGSIYHRFPTRHHLLAALWLDVVGRFHADFLPVLSGTPTPTTISEAIDRVFDWVGAHPTETLLLARLRTEDVNNDSWDPDLRAEVLDTNQQLLIAINDVAATLERDPILVVYAVIDLPAAAARRALLLGHTTVPMNLRSATHAAAGTILDIPPHGSRVAKRRGHPDAPLGEHDSNA